MADTKKPTDDVQTPDPDAGSWIRIELDDTGKLTALVFFSEVFVDGNKRAITTRHEDVEHLLSPEARASIIAMLTVPLKELSGQMASKVALDKVEFLLRNSESGDPRLKKLLLAGGVIAGGVSHNKKL